MTHEQSQYEGESRKQVGMGLAALRKAHAIKRAQLSILQTAMGRDDRTCTSDDAVSDLAKEYADGGKWVGPAVHGLALARIIVRIGTVKSARPSRHGNEVKLWRVRDDSLTGMYISALALWLERNPLPTDASLFGEIGDAA